jgi:hypothetical protein
MKNFFLILIIVALFIFNACEKKNSCPENVNLGSLSINFPSKQFVPYSNQPYLLVFKNAKNDSIKTKTVVQDYNAISLNDSVICGDGIDPFNSQFMFHESEQILRGFNYNTALENIDIQVKLYVANANSKDKIFYDKLVVRSSARNITSGLELITDTRNNTLSSELTKQINQFRYVADTTWNTKNFKNVYYSVANKFDNSAIFYNKQYGVVGIRLGDEMWVYDHFE